jgi:hypothetical protein
VPNTSGSNFGYGQNSARPNGARQRRGLAPVPVTGPYNFPGTLAVPSPPAKGADGKKLTDADKKKAIEDAIPLDQFAFDPWSDIGGVQNQPGYPGRAPLNVEIANLPQGSFGLPGMSGMPNLAGLPISGLTSVDGEHPQVTAMLQLAKAFGATTGVPGSDFFGNYSHVNDGLNHPKGLAGDFSNGTDNTPEMRNFATFLSQNFGDLLNELIYTDPMFQGTVSMGKPYTYTGQTALDHKNHVHASVSDQNAPEFMARLQALTGQVGAVLPPTFNDKMYAQNGPMQIDPQTGDLGRFQIDQQALTKAKNKVDSEAFDVQQAMRDVEVQKALRAQNLNDESDVIEAQQKLLEQQQQLEQSKLDFLDEQRGDWKAEKLDKAKNKEKPWRLEDQPFGSPQRVMGEMLSAMGANGNDIQALIGNGMGAVGSSVLGAAGGVGAGVAGDLVRSITSVELPGPMGYALTPTAPSTDPAKLIQERNPLALAQIAGIDVPDYTRQGAGDSAKNLSLDNGHSGDSMGRMYSDTAALIDRTFTNLDAAERARHDQTITALNEIKTRLGAEVLAPVVEQGMTQAFNSAGQAIGTAIGEAAGPIIGADVAAAIPNNSGGGGGGGGALSGIGGFLGWLGMASGGGVRGGQPGKDSVPAMLMPGEFVLNTSDVQRMGGFAGVERFRSAMSRQGGVRGFATGGGVNADKTVGADFFGLSQVPIIGGTRSRFCLKRFLGISIRKSPVRAPRARVRGSRNRRPCRPDRYGVRAARRSCARSAWAGAPRRLCARRVRRRSCRARRSRRPGSDRPTRLGYRHSQAGGQYLSL